MGISPKTVVITGIGLVTPVGATTESTWASLVDGRSGIGPITHFDTEEHPVRIAGEVSDFDPLEWINRKTQEDGPSFNLPSAPLLWLSKTPA